MNRLRRFTDLTGIDVTIPKQAAASSSPGPDRRYSLRRTTTPYGNWLFLPNHA